MLVNYGWDTFGQPILLLQILNALCNSGFMLVLLLDNSYAILSVGENI